MSAAVVGNIGDVDEPADRAKETKENMAKNIAGSSDWGAISIAA